MSEEQVLLISGTGGAYTIRGKDLQNSLFDKEKREFLIEKYYTYKEHCFIPENAYFIDEFGRQKKLLRRNQSGYPPLVTRTLEDILDRGHISFASIPCDTIWENRPFKRKSYKFVCCSTTFMWSERMIDTAIKWINENVEYKYLIIGGHYSSIKYEQMLSKYPEINYIIVGDGETALPQLIYFLEGDNTYQLDEIPNLAFIVRGEVIRTQVKYEDMKTLPKVSYDGHYDRLSYETVRGCAFNCKFCTWDAGIKCFRYKDSERIIEDVKEYIEENGISRIEINDSTFFFPFHRIEPVIDGFTKLGVHWKAHCRADVPWTDELVEKLGKSNCDILQIGFESMTDRVLTNMNKRTTAQMNSFTNKMLSKTRIDTVVSFIIGFPDETIEEFQNTWDYLLSEFEGHFYLFVFEMEDKSLDLWKEREKYGFELFEDKVDCVHGGANWKHNGMNSDEANEIRERVLKSVRKNNAKAIYKSWQSPYEWPFVTNQSRDVNIRIERLVDNLVFLYQDTEETNFQSELLKIVDELEKLGVFFHESFTTNTIK